MASVNKKARRTTQLTSMSSVDATANVPKTHRRNIRGRRGGLQNMPQMPLDVLFEIFAYMNPLDLLNLSRASKPLRELLTSRTSLSLWKAARKNIQGLPDCPPFLSEPAYANLCFDTHCHNCLKPGSMHIKWAVTARYCSKCNDDMFHKFDFRARSHLLHFKDHTSTPLPFEIVGETEGACHSPLYLHKPTIESFMKKWLLLSSDEQRAEAVEKHQQRRIELEQFEDLCKAWQGRSKMDRKQELQELREERINEAYRRVRKLGYKKDLDYCQKSYKYHRNPILGIPNLIQAKPWTDRSWKNMEGAIIKVMNGVRTERLFEKREALIKPRVDLLEGLLPEWRRTTGFLSPHTHNFLFVAEVKSLIDVLPDRKTGPAPNIEDLKKLEPIFYKFHEEWTARQLDTLKKSISDYLKLSLPPDIDPLSLAISQHLCCSQCSRTISFPKVLVHHCFSDSLPTRENTYECVINYMAAQKGEPTLEYMKPRDEIRDILVACGQNPFTVTSVEMDALDTRLECSACRREGILDVFTWRGALEHIQSTHRHRYLLIDKNITWNLVPLQYLPMIKELEAALALNNKRRSDVDSRWYCGHCPCTLKFMSWYYNVQHPRRSRVIDHIKKVHHIENPTEDCDFYRDLWSHWQNNGRYHVSLISKDIPTSAYRFPKSKVENGEARIVDLSLLTNADTCT